MTQKPWPIILLALLHFIAPLFNLLLGILFTGAPLDEYFIGVFNMNRWHELLVHFALIPFAGWAILMTRKWSYYVFILSMIIVIYFNYLSYQSHPTSFSLPVLFFIIALNIIVVSYFLAPSVSRVYLDSGLRWWEQKPRYPSGDLAIVTADDFKHKVTIVDISESGAKLDPYNSKVENDTPLTLEFSHGSKKYSLPFEVVHTYQDKIGVKFLHDKESKKATRQYITDLIEAGATPRTPVPPWYESLREWISQVRSGRGIFPL